MFTLTSILGPSGCGKTTLLRSFARLEAMDAGTVAMDGRKMAVRGWHRRPAEPAVMLP